MGRIGVFISSVQSEFAEERSALRDYLKDDPLMRRFFDPFLFEDLPAADRRPQDVYLDEVRRCHIYVGLFGRQYGSAPPDEPSPTEQEFDCATEVGSHRLIFISDASEDERDSRMQTLIGKAQAELVRKRFRTKADLLPELYAALVEYLSRKDLVRTGRFDASRCDGATLRDLDENQLTSFLHAARNKRQLPLSADASPDDLLEHLSLTRDGRLTNAAVLLFGKAPQRLLISSEIRCAYFHGTHVTKPIPSYQVYEGTVFQMVDQAVDFVLARIARTIGTRAESTRIPTAYEIPPEVVREAIVNAVAHRDYTETGSVQIMLFANRLEVWNPGRLPPTLTPEKLRVAHRSVPANPLLARGLYLAGYIEQMGTGTLDMVRRCRDAGLPEPEFDVAGDFIVRIRRPSRDSGPQGEYGREERSEPDKGNATTVGEKPDEYVSRLCEAIDESPDSFIHLTIRNLARIYDIPAASLRAVVSSYDHAAGTLPYEGDVLSVAAALAAMRVVAPELYQKAASDELKFDEVASFLKFPKWHVMPDVAMRIEKPWRRLTEGGIEGAGAVDRLDANVLYYVSGSVPRFGMAPRVLPTMCGAIDQSLRMQSAK